MGRCAGLPPQDKTSVHIRECCTVVVGVWTDVPGGTTPFCRSSGHARKYAGVQPHLLPARKAKDSPTLILAFFFFLDSRLGTLGTTTRFSQ